MGRGSARSAASTESPAAQRLRPHKRPAARRNGLFLLCPCRRGVPSCRWRHTRLQRRQRLQCDQFRRPWHRRTRRWRRPSRPRLCQRPPARADHPRSARHRALVSRQARQLGAALPFHRHHLGDARHPLHWRASLHRRRSQRHQYRPPGRRLPQRHDRTGDQRLRDHRPRRHPAHHGPVCLRRKRRHHAHAS